jgi:hypothetical protein
MWWYVEKTRKMIEEGKLLSNHQLANIAYRVINVNRYMTILPDETDSKRTATVEYKCASGLLLLWHPNKDEEGSANLRPGDHASCMITNHIASLMPVKVIRMRGIVLPTSDPAHSNNASNKILYYYFEPSVIEIMKISKEEGIWEHVDITIIKAIARRW